MALDLTCNRMSVRDRRAKRHNVANSAVDKNRLSTSTPNRQPAQSTAKRFTTAFNTFSHMDSSCCFFWSAGEISPAC